MDPEILKSYNVTKGDLLCASPFIKNMYVAGGTSTGTVMLFPFSQDYRSRRLIGHRAPVTCMSVSERPLWLATGSEDTTVRFWQIRGNDDSCITIEPNDGSIRALALSPNADRLLIAGRLSNPALWDPFDKSIVQQFEHHDSTINAVALNTKASIAVTGAADGKARIFDIRSGKFLRSVDCYSPITALSLNTDGTRLAIGTVVGTAYLVEVETGYILQSTRIHNQDITSLMIQPNGNLMLTGSSDSSVILTDITTFEPVFTLGIHKDKIVDVHFSTDGSQFTTCSADHKVFLWSSPDMTIQDDRSESTEADDEIPAQKPPPIPEPVPDNKSIKSIKNLRSVKSRNEIHRLSYLQSPSSSKQSPRDKSQSITDAQPMSPMSHDLSDLSVPSGVPIRDKFGKIDKRKKTKNLLYTIKQPPTTKEVSASENEFNLLLKQCDTELSIIVKKLLEIDEKLKSNDEKIAKLEATQVARAEIAKKRANARRVIRK